MPIPAEFASRSLHHITHIDNLLNIIEHGILSSNERQCRNITHANIAYSDIQYRRSTMSVPCGSGGVVHDYVPLYFCKRCPMLYVVNRRITPQNKIIYFEFPIQILAEYNSVFTDASANTVLPPNFYIDHSNLANLDWGAIDTLDWGPYCEPTGEIKKRKQAEALIYRILPLIFLKKIIVYDRNCKNQVDEITEEYGINIPTIISGQRDYYF